LAVKRSQSASRVLSAFELVAAHQPIGVSALAKLLDDDRSAVQRAVMTLADAGWIRMAPEAPVRWELSAHIFTLAHLPDSTRDLRLRTRGALESLRDETGETTFLAVPDVNRFVVIEAAESTHTLRMTSRVGQVIAPRESATGRAFLPYVDAPRQAAMLGREPDARDLAEFAATRARGFGLSAGDVMPGATNLAAVIFDSHAEPVAALVVSGPSERLTPDRHAEVGALLARHAAALSRGRPSRASDKPERPLSQLR
jgi:IclR family acetate operon transcriptional repressor